MAAPKPVHYEDLDQALAHAWGLLREAVTKRDSPLRTPALATRGRDGAPAARTVILRAVDPERRIMCIHTDARSAKVEEIAAEPRVTMLFHHPGENIQLRATGTARVRRNAEQDRTAWDATVPPVRRAYMGEAAPGQPSAQPTGGFPAEFIGRLPTREESESAFRNFAVIEVAVARLEWLYLNPDGHRRAAFAWTGGARTATWIVP